MISNYSTTTTPWQHNLTDLRYDHRGYEVEVTARNDIGQSVNVMSSPIRLSAGTWHTV